MNALTPAREERAATSTPGAAPTLQQLCAAFVTAEEQWREVDLAADRAQPGPEKERLEAEEAHRTEDQADRLDQIIKVPCASPADLHAVATALVEWDQELLQQGAGDTRQLLTAHLVRGVLAVSAPEAAGTEAPDARLIAICARLREQQKEWQRLWAACPDEPTNGPEDQAFDDYTENVYPAWGRFGSGVNSRNYRLLHDGDDDLIGQVRVMAATTAEGLREKGAVIVALDRSEQYVDAQRVDRIYLWMSLAEDAAAGTAMHLGEQA